jgi:hypothetical protein
MVSLFSRFYLVRSSSCLETSSRLHDAGRTVPTVDAFNYRIFVFRDWSGLVPDLGRVVRLLLRLFCRLVQPYPFA